MKKNDKLARSELAMETEINKCVLCHDAPCKNIYKKIDPSRIIRAIKFENTKGALTLANKDPLFEKNEDCDTKCPLNVNIDYILKNIIKDTNIVNEFDNIDLSTTVCGIKLENPFLLSSSIVGSNYDMCKRALESGWAGISVKTISLMQIDESSPRFSTLKENNNNKKFLGFKNIEQLSEHSVEENMKMIKKLKKEFPKKVIISSIMGRDENEWKYLTKEVTKAGADIIELNFSCPNMKHKGTGSDVGQNPELVEKFTRIVKENTNIPVLAKMTPNITDMCIPAIAAKKGGADGISAINTIKCITNVDIDTLVPEPQVNGKSSLGGYSGRAVKPIALRYISDMTNNPKLKDLYYSGMGGIYTWKDAVEFILLGCTSIQITTAILEYGYRIIDDLIMGLKIYMKEKNYKRIADFVGLSKSNLIKNDELDKDTIEFPIFNYDRCIGCGRCYISCRDGGHQAIKFDEDRKPTLDGRKCVGCHLCRLVCPQKAIDIAPKRINKNIINTNSNKN